MTFTCPTLHTRPRAVCTNGQEGRRAAVHVSDFAHAIRQRVHIRTRPVPICRASVRLRTRPSRSRAYADALAAAPGPSLRLEPRNRSLLLSYAPNQPTATTHRLPSAFPSSPASKASSHHFEVMGSRARLFDTCALFKKASSHHFSPWKGAVLKQSSFQRN